VSELGEAPARRRQDMFRQARENLSGERRLVIIDEADFLASDFKVLETVRALHDASGAPFILMGMQEFPRKVRRYPHIYDRVLHTLEFQPLRKEEVAQVARELCEVEVADDAISYITDASGGRIRHVIRLLYYAERKAKVNNLKVVDLKALGRNGRRVP